MAIKIVQDQLEEKKTNLENWTPKKEDMALDYINDKVKYFKTKFNKGDIVLCDLGENIGSEQNKKRPVVIITPLNFNKSGVVVIN